MAMGRVLSAVFLSCVCVSGARGESLSWAWDHDLASTLPPGYEMIPLTLPAGTTLQIAVAKEVRVKKVGQPLHGFLVEPLFVFDQELVPVGSEVVGRITKVEGVSRKKRFLAALNADFTPTRKIQVEFDEIILPDGKRLSINTVVTPGSGRVIRLVTTLDQEKKKTSQNPASAKMKQAIQEAKQKWNSAMKQIKQPGRMHRLKRYAVAQLPVHPQYIDAGTVYFAELEEPLDFGSKPLPPQAVTSSETPTLPCRVLAHAQLVTPLSSATTKQDDPVEAVLSQPLFDGDRLLFPQGSRLKGSVVQVQPARRFTRNGKLRILFHELVLPDGIEQKVDTNLEGIQAGQSQDVKLDSEGGTQPAVPKKRFLATGVAVTLAIASYEDSPDAEHGVTSASGNASQGAAGGAAGFKLVGILVGAFVRSRPLSLGMGIYGAGRSAYSNVVARGLEVSFPKGTAMEVGFWLRRNCDDPVKAD